MISSIRKNLTIEILIVNLTLLLFIFRTAFPQMKYPFLVLYLSCLIYFSLMYRKDIIRALKEFIRDYLLLLLLVLILIFSFLLTYKIYLTIFKDILNILAVLSLFFILSLIVRQKKELDFYVDNLVSLMLIFGIIVSIIGFTDLLGIINYEHSFRLDYNFASLPVFFGLFGIFYLLPKYSSRTGRFLLYSLTIIYVYYLFLAGSRRGFIVILGIIILLIFLQLLMIVRKSASVKRGIYKHRSVLLFLTIVFLIVSVSCHIFLFQTPYEFKLGTFKLLGTQKISFVKYKLTNRYYRYATVFGKVYDYPELFNKIWDPVFDPKDPDRGWGTRLYKTIYPLTGDNVEIVPEGSKGCLMDNTCNANSWGGNAYSFTKVWSDTITPGDSIVASVYCYVSNDFNGEWARLSAEGAVSGSLFNDYEMDKKGTWQKLVITPESGEGLASIHLFFCKNGNTDFASLNGYVIFAFPFVVQNKKLVHSELTTGSCPGQNIKQVMKDVELTCGNIQEHKASMMGFRFKYLLRFVIGSQDKDIIRRLTEKLVSEDTIYRPLKAYLSVDTISNAFIHPRIRRWQFAFQIYFKEYGLAGKIFGGGFSFLNWYGDCFAGDRKVSDYPHNPFLSILLYSGLLGLSLYLLLFYKVLKYYLLYIKEYFVLPICFCITFFFTFFSGGSPFDPPVMGVFMILPFFIHSVLQKEIEPTGE